MPLHALCTLVLWPWLWLWLWAPLRSVCHALDNPEHRVHRLHNAEMLLYSAEHQREQDVKAMLKKENIHINAFFHTSTRDVFWPHVLEEQLKIIDGYFAVPNLNASDEELARGAYQRLRSDTEPHGRDFPA